MHHGSVFQVYQRYRDVLYLFPYCSDDVPPTKVGVPATITANMSAAPNESECKCAPTYYNRKLQVMRFSLSTPHNLIYKYMTSNVGEDVKQDSCDL